MRGQGGQVVDAQDGRGRGLEGRRRWGEDCGGYRGSQLGRLIRPQQPAKAPEEEMRGGDD